MSVLQLLSLLPGMVMAGMMEQQWNTSSAGLRTLAWSRDARWPLLVASTVLAVQSALALIFLFIVRGPVGLTGAAASLAQTTLPAHAATTFIGSICYASYWLGDRHLVVDIPGYGQSLLARNLYLLVSTGQQWFVYSQVCTRNSWRDSWPVVLVGILIQALGEVSPLPEPFCLMATCVACSAAFLRFLGQPLMPLWTGASQRVAFVSLVACIMLPCVGLIRYTKLISNWGEQVLIYTFVDITAKMCSFLLIILACILSSCSAYKGAGKIKSNQRAKMQVRMSIGLTRISSCGDDSNDTSTPTLLDEVSKHRVRRRSVEHNDKDSQPSKLRGIEENPERSETLVGQKVQETSPNESANLNMQEMPNLPSTHSTSETSTCEAMDQSSD